MEAAQAPEPHPRVKPEPRSYTTNFIRTVDNFTETDIYTMRKKRGCLNTHSSSNGINIFEIINKKYDVGFPKSIYIP